MVQWHMIITIFLVYFKIKQGNALSPVIKNLKTQNISEIFPQELDQTSLNTINMFKTNEFFIGLQSIQGRIKIYDYLSQKLVLNIQFGSEFQNTTKVVAFDISDTNPNQIAIIAEKNELIKLSIQNSTILSAQKFPLPTNEAYLNLNFHTVQIIKDQILVVGFYQTAFILRYEKSKNYSNPASIVTNFTNRIFNIKSCMIDDSKGWYVFGVWKSSCYVEAYNCTILGNCTQIYTYNNTACSYEFYMNSNTRHKLDFSFDCSKISFQSKENRLMVVNLLDPFPNSNFTLLTSPALVTRLNTQQIFDYSFLDNNSQYLDIAFKDKSFTVYDIENNIIVSSQCLDLRPQIICFNRLRSSYIYSDFKEYRIGQLQFDNINASSLQSGQICNCQVTQIVNSTISSLANTTNITISTNTTTAIKNTTILNINFTFSSPNQISSNKTLTTPTIECIYEYERQIGQTTAQAFHNIGTTVAYAALFLQIFPFSFLFMRFINFWSVCSMYLLLNIKLPTYLQSILLSIYANINDSIFSQFNIDLNMKTNIQEKFSQQDEQIYGLSSDVINGNIENFLIMIVSFDLLALLFLMSKILPKDSFLRKQLAQINFELSVIAQYIAIMNSFIINFSILTHKSYQNAFVEKINLMLQNLFFILSAFIVCLIIIVQDKKVTTKFQKQQNFKQKLDWFIDSMSNVLIPCTAIIRNVPLFLTSNFIFFCLPIYSAIKQRQFRLNRILLSLYIPIFNLGMILMAIFKSETFPNLFHNVGLISSVVLFMGAIHEISTLFCGFIYIMVKSVMSKCQKVSSTSLQKQTIQQGKSFKLRRKSIYSFEKCTQKVQICKQNETVEFKTGYFTSQNVQNSETTRKQTKKLQNHIKKGKFKLKKTIKKKTQNILKVKQLLE